MNRHQRRGPARAARTAALGLLVTVVAFTGPTAEPSTAAATLTPNAAPPPLQKPVDAPEGKAPASAVRQQAEAAMRSTDNAGRAAAEAQRAAASTAPTSLASPNTAPASAGKAGAGIVDATYREGAPTTITTLAAAVPATGTTANGRGDYAATPLAPSGTWSAGGSSGSFTWSYPVTAPEPAVGPAPDLTMTYSSASVDGRLPNTNNQPSWLGEGWEFANSYVERSYNTCKDDGQSGKYDLCWKTPNASIVLNGSSTEIVKDDSTGLWRLKDDDSSTVELLTGAANGDNDGEYWRVTTTDGTQYYFGKEVLPGAPAGTVTGATWTVPVFGDDTGEPCHTSTTFTANGCTQAWRWNLDYVVDTNDNAMTLWYTKESNSYYKAGASYASYIRGGYLKEIKYGLRSSTLFAGAGYRVTFGVSERCIQSGTTCSSLTSTTKQYWPDVPYSAICSTSCTANVSPTFFTRKRLTSVATAAWNPSLATPAYQAVDSWTITHLFLDPGDTGDSTDQSLWVSKIQRTGQAGTALTLPATTFSHTFLKNRVDGTTDGILPLTKPRISSIVTDTGASIVVTYLGAECTPTTKPTPDTNTKRCFPTYWYPNGTSTATLDWFHRYPVAKVTVDAGQGSPAVETAYSYDSAGMAWHYDDSPLTVNARRTWSQARGYAQVTTYVGSATSAARSKTLSVYLRGMDGDKTSTGTRSVSVTGVKAPAYTDSDQYAGFLREQVTYLGNTSTLVAGTVNTPWSRQTSTHVVSGAPTTKGWLVRTAATMAWQAISGKADRTRTTTTSYDTAGFATTIDDTGDPDSGGATCTTNTYGRNTTKNILDTVVRTQVLGVRCSAASTAALPANATPTGDVVSDTLTLFDSTGTWAAAQTPSRGNPTWTGRAKGYATDRSPLIGSGSRTVFDALGRPTSVTDALGRATTTSYTPAAALPATSTTSIPPLLSPGTKTDLDVRTGAATKVTDPNGKVTESTYDAVGRLTGVWLPTSSKAGGAAADIAYTYTDSNAYGVASSAKTTTTASGGASSYDFYDGLGRLIQSQQPTPIGGRLISDTVFDTEGRTFRSLMGVWDSAVPAATRFNTLVSTAPSQTLTTYDGAGRVATTSLVTMGTTLYTTATTYTGESVKASAPTGGTASETFTDALGRLTKTRQYAGTQPTGSYLEATTRYNSLGRQDRLTGPDGAVWDYSYDLYGRTTSATDPDSGTTATTYDEGDRVVTTTDARGQSITTDYDALDRPTAKWAGPSGTGAKLAAWTYDTVAKGQPATATSYRGSTPGTPGSAYTRTVTGYDGEYNSTGWTTTLPADDPFVAAGVPQSLSFAATFDEGAPATSTEPAVAGMPAETFTYTYGPTRVPAKISSQVATYLYSAYFNEYREPGRLNLRAGTGHYVTLSSYYDPPTRRVTRSVATDSLHSWYPSDTSYTYDDAGNVRELEDAATMGGAGQADTQCFTFDGYRRLDQAWTPTTGDCTTAPTSTAQLGGPAPYWNDYDHNTDGSRAKLIQRSTAGTTTTAYAYGGAGAPVHALTTVTGGPAAGSYSYDQTGATTSRPGPTGQQTLTWDPFGRMRTLTQPDPDTTGTATTEMIYGADGGLIERRSTDDDGDSVLYLGATEIHLTKTNGTPKPLTSLRYYTAAGQTIGVRSATAGSTTTILTWLAGDQHATTTVAVDSVTMDVTKRYVDPFGQRRDNKAAWIDDKLFLGKPADTATGLTHIGAREYDPITGRFISVDPILDTGDLQSLNGYYYGNGNPATFTDPSGTRIIDDVDGQGNATQYVKPTSTKKHQQIVRTRSYYRSRQPSRSWISNNRVRMAMRAWAAARNPSAHYSTGNSLGGPTVTVAQAYPAVPYTATLSDVGHFALDAAGTIPGIGEPADGLNALWYGAEGDYLNSGLSAAGMIPFIGWGATASKVGLKAAAEATTASKPLIIGENMDRVRAYAEQVGGHAYRPWTNSDFALGMQRNGRMIKDVMRADREIIDIGPDFARRAAGRDPSPFYNLERQLTDGYDNYTSVFKRFGRLEGGVPGLDF